MNHTSSGLQEVWSPEIVRDAKIVRLKKDFLGSSIFVFSVAFGLYLFAQIHFSIFALLVVFSMAYGTGWSLLKKDYFIQALTIYFVAPLFIVLSLGLFYPELRLEGLLFIPLIIDTFNYVDNYKQKVAHIILFSLAAFICLIFDITSTHIEMTTGFSIISSLLLFLTISFTAANIQNLLNSPSHYIPKILSAEKTIKTDRHKFRNIFENTMQGIFIYDLHSQNIIDSNPAFLRMVSLESVEGADFLAFILQDEDKASLKRVIQKVIETQIANRIDIELKTAKGQILQVEGTVIPYDVKNNNVAISLHDITKRISAFKAKAESEALYHSLIETSSSGIIQTDLDGNIKFVSSAGASIFGLNRSELIDTHIYKLFYRVLDKDQRHNISKSYEILQDKGLVKLPHFKINDPIDGVKHLEGSTNFLKNADGEKIGYLMVFNDITMLMESQAKMLENGLIFQSFLNHSFEGVDVTEIMDSRYDAPRGRLILRNQRMRDIIGDSTNVFLSFEDQCTLYDIQGETQTALAYKKFQEHTKTIYKNRSLQTTNRFRINDDIKYVNSTYQVIDVADKKFLIRVFRDVTRQRQQDKEIRTKNQELHNYIESNISLTNFAAVASHDLKAPLRTINSFAQLLNRMESQNLSNSGKEYLDLILSSSNHLGRLVEDILNFSKVNTHNLKFRNEEPYKMVNSVLNELESLISTSDSLIIVDDLPESIMCESIKFKQVLSNLIRNAIKFTKPDLKNTIAIGCEDDQNYWRFYVKDNGIGISESNKSSIFKLFGRLHTQEEYEGSGIGLAVCSKIIKAHRGEITVESEVGVGSTFYFTVKKNLTSTALLV